MWRYAQDTTHDSAMCRATQQMLRKMIAHCYAQGLNGLLGVLFLLNRDHSTTL
jgi:hypothetical protein